MNKREYFPPNGFCGQREDSAEQQGAAFAVLPPPDALQEFKVQTSNFTAEFGRAGGAVVNATIKSGTNQLHLSLRNNTSDAGIPGATLTPGAVPDLFQGYGQKIFSANARWEFTSGAPVASCQVPRTSPI